MELLFLTVDLIGEIQHYFISKIKPLSSAAHFLRSCFAVLLSAAVALDVDWQWY